MDYSDLKKIYESAKKIGAIGMLVIDWTPGKPDTKQYIPINDSEFEKAAAAEFVRAVNEKNEKREKDDQLDVREFRKNGPNPSDFDLPSITYTKLAANPG